MDEHPTLAPPNIGTLNENPFHAALKAAYTQAGDRLEVPVEGFCVDLVRGDLLVEFQTANFSAMRRKLSRLLANHRVRLVHPIAAERWIVRTDRRGDRAISRRKSPKRGCVDNVFEELVSLPDLLADPNFSLEVLMVREEEIRRQDRRKWRRGGWATVQRRLIEIVDRWVFQTPADLADLLPTDLPEPFTTADLARAMGQPKRLAQKMAYCLRHAGALRLDGKRGNAFLYVRTTAAA